MRHLPWLLLLAALPLQAQTPDQIIASSIEFHDPDDQWPSLARTITLEVERKDRPNAFQHVTFDFPNQTFRVETGPDSMKVIKQWANGVCTASINGSTELTEEQIKSNRLGCDLILRSYHYYQYMLGLPMKLRDPGTIVDDEVKREMFNGSEVLSIRVTYTEDVGADIWYFYFDPSSYEFVGCRFYHDESKNDGEYITMAEPYAIGNLKLPAVRGWYYNDERGYLATDRIVGDAPIDR